MHDVKTYTGDFHREGDVWVAEVREVPQAHTYGRTLTRAKEHLRDALALYLDVDVDDVEIRVHLSSNEAASALLETAQSARTRADDAAAQARQATSAAALALVQTGLSMRDAGAALGVSHQRVEQLVAEGPRTATGPTETPRGETGHVRGAA